MYFKILLTKHYNQIKKGGIKTLLKKLISLFFIFLQLPVYLISVPIFVIITLIKPWYLIRWNSLYSSRLGHFTVCTELYCCERDANINFPKQKYKDFFYLSKFISNKTLEKMWRRSLTILPSWLLKPIHKISNFFYSLLGKKNIHEINNISTSDRDIHNLFEKSNTHISFTENEEIKGKKILEKFGLLKDAKFVCLIVRDKGYLSRNSEYANSARWDYHDYRNCDIDKYVLASEELASRGYYVFRVGTHVEKPLKSKNIKIIDYANSELRSDFMDIYLGAKCSFCVSTATGFDGIPVMFRKPIASIVVPLGSILVDSKKNLSLTKHHINKLTKKELSISEIFSSNVATSFRTEEFKNNNVVLQENTPEEIRDLVIEMDERINKNWKETDEDILLQENFWSIFKKNMGTNLHQKENEKFKEKFSAKYLRDNKNWIN
jgi:putative glycosyltransferase (TIGR04372 family)